MDYAVFQGQDPLPVPDAVPAFRPDHESADYLLTTAGGRLQHIRLKFRDVLPTDYLDLAEEVRPIEEEHVAPVVGCIISHRPSGPGSIDPLQIVKELRERYKNIRIDDKSKIFNTELQEAIEFGHMLDYSLFIVESALARKESRGAHYREDYTARDDENFLKHTMAYMDAEGNITLDYMNVVLGKHELKARNY